MWPAIFTSRPCRIFNFSDELRTYGFYKVHSSSNFQKKCIKVTENCHFIVYVQFDMNSFNRMMIHCLNLFFLIYAISIMCKHVWCNSKKPIKLKLIPKTKVKFSGFRFWYFLFRLINE